ncbi:YwdI family protein [Paucisalibacillus sp. EB02]|uniref:YwdI family protein n=1 Tax=Paucisalibacillus sp. EB02 TaxID=1347087 RepID=UPI0004BAF1E5|nr:YwdI family protein [Paucisalibacillus sp. EB02]
MAVANNTILQKMMYELDQAKQKQDQADMLKHIENIRLLCDLFLPEEKNETTSIESPEVSADELKTMLGKTPSSKPQPTYRKSIELDDEDGNGDSLFDF